MNVQRGGWTWFTENPAVLEPWADSIGELLAHPVKHNAVRSVCRATGSDGSGYFVKIERKPGLLNLLRNRFFSKAQSEYKSGRLLVECGIPCAEYLAWGRCGASSAVVSRALDGWISALKYWYTEARFDGRKKQLWLDAFFDLTFRFCENSLTHPDFHAGNVLLNPATNEYALIDAYGIRRKNNLDEQDLRDILSWILPLRMDVPDDELIQRLERRRILSQPAEPFFRETVRLNNARLDRDWEKRRRRQILSGNSKFSHTEGNREIRHSLWYEAVPLPDEAELNIRELDMAAAQTEWLESFRRQLRGKKLDAVPLIFEKNGAKTRLFMLSGKKKSYFF